MADQKSNDATDQVNATFNRLRARLFNMVESSLSNDSAACEAMKKSIRDYTSQAWNNIIKILRGE